MRISHDIGGLAWETAGIHNVTFHLMQTNPAMRSVLDDCCVQLLIMMDGERNHSMGSPMDGTPPQSED